MKKAIGLIVAAVVIFAGTFFAFLTVESRPVDAADDSKVFINIEEGSGASQIAAQLAESGLIRNELAFKLKSKFSGAGTKFQAGAYAVSKSMSTESIIDMIADGRTAAKSFRIIEGLSLDKIASQLASQDICTEEEFFKEVESGEFDHPFMKYLQKGPTRLEGFLFPDTYNIPLDGGAHEAIEAMLTGFDSKVTDEYYDKAKQRGMTIDEVITAASIIEREASFKEDKAKVASVIYNRIDKDMYLQMDSIIAYIHKEDKVIATYGDIAVDSAYNPYKNKGLPPGPICSPGIDAIDAALEPADTNYLYFVNSDKMDGSLTFCENETQFSKAKAAFEKAYAEYLKEHPEESDD